MKKFFNLIPFLVLLPGCVANYREIAKHKKIFLLTIAWPLTICSVIGYYFLFYKGVSPFEILIRLSATGLISFFIPLLYLNFPRKKDLKYILSTVTTMLILIGSSFIIFEFVSVRFLRLFTHIQFHHWLYPTLPPMAGYVRVNGFLVSKEISGIAILAAWLYQFHEFLNARIENRIDRKMLIQYCIMAGLGVIAIIFCDSIILFSIFFGLTLLTILLRFKELNLTIYKLSMGILVLINAFLLSPTKERIVAYVAKEWNWSRYSFVIKDCKWQQFIISYDAASTNCSANEFHFFHPLFSYGIITYLGWIVLVFSPLVLLPSVLKKGREFFPEIFLCLAFIGSIVHYSGVEAWGNNYLYMICVYFLVMAVFSKPNHVPNKT